MKVESVTVFDLSISYIKQGRNSQYTIKNCGINHVNIYQKPKDGRKSLMWLISLPAGYSRTIELGHNEELDIKSWLIGQE